MSLVAVCLVLGGGGGDAWNPTREMEIPSRYFALSLSHTTPRFINYMLVVLIVSESSE